MTSEICKCGHSRNLHEEWVNKNDCYKCECLEFIPAELVPNSPEVPRQSWIDAPKGLNTKTSIFDISALQKKKELYEELGMPLALKRTQYRIEERQRLKAEVEKVLDEMWITTTKIEDVSQKEILGYNACLKELKKRLFSNAR